MLKETYAEAGVKQKSNIKCTLLRVLLIAFIPLTIVLSGLSKILFFLPVVAIMAVYFIFPLLKVEYEYIFVDGQFDFDRILGGAKRKTVLQIDMEDVEVGAPSGYDEVKAYDHNANLKVYNFSSGDPEARTYTLIAAKNSEYMKIIFEPTETMVECMRGKAPRKIRL